MAHKIETKRRTITNTTRIQKEQLPVFGKAIPSYSNLKADSKWANNLAFKQSLAVPKMNSVVGQQKEIDKIGALKPPRYTTIGNLTPKTKTAIMPKINQHLNFDVSRPVFRNLMPINVNDSLLLPRERTSIRKKYTYQKSNKPPAPDLADFLDPIKPLTHVIPLPDIKIEFPKQKPNPMEIFERYIDNSLLEQSIPYSGLK